MKKTNILKVLMTLTLALVISGAFAQNNTGSTQWTAAGQATVGDYTRSNGTPITNPADALVTAPTDKITIGQAMPFFVWPSAAYNPDFDYTALGTDYSAITDVVTGVTSDFAWVSAGGAITNYYSDGTAVDDGNGIKNYVEISWAAAGNQVIQVTETPASGVCPASSVYFGVEVIAQPNVTITSAAALGLDRVIESNCWAVATDNETAIPFTINNANEEYPYHFRLTYTIYNVDGLDGSGNLPVDGNNDLDATDPSVSAALAYDNKINGVVAGTPSAANPIVVNAGTDLLAAATDFEVKNNKITVYEFDLAGYSGKISRKSDYVTLRNGALDNTLYQNYSVYGTAEKFYVVALPTPVTGPIYHIDNTWGL